MTSSYLTVFLACCYLSFCTPVVKAASIYGDNEPVKLSTDEQQGIVGTLTVLLFLLMATEITGPEVLFLIALMIVTLCEIITLTDCLSGKCPSLSCSLPALIPCPSRQDLRTSP